MLQLSNLKKKPVIIAIVVVLALVVILFAINSSDDSTKLVGTWVTEDGGWTLTFNKNGSLYDSECGFVSGSSGAGYWEVISDGKLHLWSMYNSETFSYELKGRTLILDQEHGFWSTLTFKKV